jgi:hypothetical protein
LVSILSLHLKLLWSFCELFTHENGQLGALDIKADTYEAKFTFKCHTCGICLSALVEIPVFTRTAGPHPVCQLMGTGGCLPGIEQSAHETRHSPPSGASITNMWICTFTPTCASLTWCLFTHMNNFSVTYWMMKQYLNMPHPRRSLFNKWTSINNTMFYARISTVSFLDKAVFNLT